MGGGNYLEFGAGGSTFLALLHSNTNIYSVESDKNWIDSLQKWKFIQDNNKRLLFWHVFIGKTGGYGVPIEQDKKELFPQYSLFPFLNKQDYDVVFIDGRFRVACAVQAALHCKCDAKILMHDFNNRKNYHIVLRFLDIVDTADTMALFKIKPTNKEILRDVYEKYKYNFH